MIPMPLSEIAGVTGGTLHGDDVLVSGEAFLDSRRPLTGGLFVAFAGEKVDGHEFAGAALANGAVAVLGTRPVDGPTVVVDDVERALADLAREVLARRRLVGGLSVIALTGSQGKTSTKDLLARVLADVGPTVATYGSFNNEIGLPLTVLRVTGETRFLVLEMGARGLGHLRDLCAVAPPDVSVVLNVGRAHIGEFGSQDAIAQAKGELVEALGPDGVAVLNADDERVAAMAARTVGRVLTFGNRGDVGLGDVTLDELGRASFDLTHAGRTEHVALRLLGEHHARNAAAAAAAALAAGVGLPAAAASLRAVETLSKWRMQLLERADGLRVINDAYNANPDSMRAAVETLAAIGRSSGARTVAVLGEMLELGETSAAEHRAVGELVAGLGVDELVVVGAAAGAIADGAQTAGMSRTPLRTRDVHEAARIVRETVRGPDVVLVKASRGAALETVALALIDEALMEEHG